MSGDVLWRMGPCPRRYRPRCKRDKLETGQQAIKRDRQRALLLRRMVQREEVGGRLAEAASSLAERLDPHIPKIPPCSKACARASRQMRMRVPGHLWAVLDHVPEPRRFFTLIPRYGDVPAERLAKFKPAQVLARLRAALNDQGAVGATGILWCMLEASYEIRLNLFRFHVHGVATGEMVQVVDRLRKTRALRGGYLDGETARNGVWTRVKLSRRELYGLPYPLTYLMKAFWSAHWVNDEGKRGARRGLPGRAAVQALVWQDRWGPGDLVLMRGMRAHRGGFSLISTRDEEARRLKRSSRPL